MAHALEILDLIESNISTNPNFNPCHLVWMNPFVAELGYSNTRNMKNAIELEFPGDLIMLPLSDAEGSKLVNGSPVINVVPPTTIAEKMSHGQALFFAAHYISHICRVRGIRSALRNAIYGFYQQKLEDDNVSATVSTATVSTAEVSDEQDDNNDDDVGEDSERDTHEEETSTGEDEEEGTGEEVGDNMEDEETEETVPMDVVPDSSKKDTTQQPPVADKPLNTNVKKTVRVFHVSIVNEGHEPSDYLAVCITSSAQSKYIALRNLRNHFPEGVTCQFEKTFMCSLAGAVLRAKLETSLRGPNDILMKKDNVRGQRVLKLLSPLDVDMVVLKMNNLCNE